MQMLRGLKRVWLLLFTACICGLLVLYFSIKRLQMEEDFYSNHIAWLNQTYSHNWSESQTTCHLPDIDPFDPTIMKYIKKFELVCPDHPYLTIMDENGYIYLNKSGFKSANKSPKYVYCCYYSLKGVDGNKRKLIHGPKVKITAEPTRVNSEFVGVKCTESNETIYQNVHFYIPKPDKKLQDRNRRAVDEGKQNVLIVSVDSMSRLSFMRNLPKAYEYLTVGLGSVVMRGMNKNGINTHPNMLALLAGYKANPEDPGDGTPYVENTTYYYDELPLVWKNFSREGYVTMWLDEMAEMGLFYYYTSLGFHHGQTDYQPRPMILEMEDLGVTQTTLCFRNTPMYNFVFDYLEKFINTMKDTVYFALTSITRISHEDLNTPQAMDSNLHELLERLYDKGSLNNTVLIVMGDHGSRIGTYRNTFFGFIEDSMPFLSIYLPQRLRDERPQLQAKLLANSGRLMSWFDIHEMLLDLATLDLGAEPRRAPSVVGVSPLRAIPENRSCADAGIPLNYCACMTAVEVAVTEEVVMNAAQQVVDHVNVLLGKVAGHPCANLRLLRIDSAAVLTHPETMPKGFVEILRVTVQTRPGLALLQATVARRASNQLGQVYGDVERINRYGNQSWCVAYLPDPRLQMYCMCKAQ